MSLEPLTSPSEASAEPVAKVYGELVTDPGEMRAFYLSRHELLLALRQLGGVTRASTFMRGEYSSMQDSQAIPIDDPGTYVLFKVGEK